MATNSITRYRPRSPGAITPRRTGTEPAMISGPATVHSRRRPWPYDLEINGVPLILRPQEDGLMIGKKVQSLQGVVPITYDYSSQPVYAERTYAFRHLRGGYGERVQEHPVPQRYFYALNADLSIGGLQMKGPLFHPVTPPATGCVYWFLDASDPTAPTPPGYPAGWPPLSTYAGAGQYVLRRTADTAAGWVVSRDFGAGVTVTKAVRFRAAGPGQPDAIWVVTSANQLWRFDGTTWTQSAQAASSIAVLRDELWVKDGTNTVCLATADPLLAASFGAQIRVGDASQPVTNLDVLDNILYIFKTNGIFTVNPDTSVNDKFPSFRVQPLPRNGVNACAWLGRLWFGYGDGYYWLDNAGNLTATGPNLLMENNSEVSGEVTAFTGHAAWFGYYGLWNKGPTMASAGAGDSYLLKHGTWLNPEGDATDYRFSEVANGAIKKWAGKKITSLYVSDAAQGNARLYAGFEDGSIEWCLLPRGTPNPAHPDSGCEFTDQEAWVTWPLHHGMFQADAKSYRGFSAFGPRIDQTNTVLVQYRLVRRSVEAAPPPTQTPWRQVAPFTYSGQRNDLEDDVFGYAVEVRHGLVSTTSSTPVLEGVALHEQVRPALLLEYTWTVNARRHLARRDGVGDHGTPWQIWEAAMGWAATVGTVEALLPDEGVQALSVVDYSEALAPVTKRYGADWDVAMRAIQFRTLTVYGSWDRVALYDWDTIGDYTWDDLLFL